MSVISHLLIRMTLGNSGELEDRRARYRRMLRMECFSTRKSRCYKGPTEIRGGGRQNSECKHPINSKARGWH